MTLTGCCCFDLRTGAIIIGVLDLISSCNSILSIFKSFLNLDAIFAPDGPLQSYANESQCDPECMSHIRKIVVIILAVLLVLYILSLTASSLLIHGIRKNKPGLITAYLVKVGFVLGLLAVGVLLSMILVFKSPGVVFILTLPLSLMFMLMAYFYMVVRDYKVQLLQQEGAMPTRLLEEQSPYPVKG